MLSATANELSVSANAMPLYDISLGSYSIAVGERASDNAASAFGSDATARRSGTDAAGSGATVYAGVGDVVAPDAGANTNRNYSVLVGNDKQQRQIENMRAGTADIDAVNVTQSTKTIEQMSGRADTLSSNLKSRPSLLMANPLAAKAQAVSDFVSIDGMGADGSLPNNASIAAGDRDSTTAAAVGVGSQAAGADAIAIGLSSNALSDNSVGIGSMAQTGAGQPYSVAIGSHAFTSGAGALAIGSNVQANGDNAIAVGNHGVAAIGQNSIAIGNGAQSATGAVDSIAFGTSADVAPGVTGAMALGARASVASDTNSAVALGTGSLANRANTVSVGGGTAGLRQIVNIAAGTQDADAVNVKQLSGVATALGGGAGIDANGKVTAPKYHIGGEDYDNVGEAIAAAAEIGTGTDPNAVEYEDETKNTVKLAGEHGTTLKNVAAGTVDGASMEAVNGSQLFGASESVAKALGGGATVNEAGQLTAPKYALEGGTKTVASVGDAVSNLDGRVTTNATNVENLHNEFINSGLMDDTGKVLAVTYDRKEDGTADRGSVTLGGADAPGAVALKNVAPGVVSATSKDAVNGSQLFGASEIVAKALGGGATVNEAGQLTAPSYVLEDGTKTVASVGDAVSNLDGRVTTNATNVENLRSEFANSGLVDDTGKSVAAVTYDRKADGATDRGSVTLGGADAPGAVALKNVAPGVVSATSKDAVNGSQLFGASEIVAKALGGGATVNEAGQLTAPSYALEDGTKTVASVGDAVSNLDGRVTTNATNVENLRSEFANSGLVDDTGKSVAAVTYDRKADGTTDRGSVTLGGADASGTVALKNVADGVADTDAVNWRQLNTGLSTVTSDLEEGNIQLKYIKVKANGAPAIAGGNQAVAIGSQASASGPNTLAFGAGARAVASGAVALGFNSVAADPMTVSVGAAGSERKIVHVKAGEIAPRSTDAINGAQLFTALGELKSHVAADQSRLLSRFTLENPDAPSDFFSVAGKVANSTATVTDGDVDHTAIAIGVGSAAAGADAFAAGVSATANSDNSVAIGSTAQTGAGQPDSVAIGSHVYTNGAAALAIGSNVQANGENAIAVGNHEAQAIGLNSIAIGNNAQSGTDAIDGIAFGTGADVAQGAIGAMALGARTSVEANNAVALGTGSKANRADTVSVGGGTAGLRQIVNVAAGVQDADAVNVKQLSGVAAALGGGARIDANGNVTAPKYHVGGEDYDNVGDAIKAAAASGGATDSRAVRYDVDAQGNPNYGSVTLGGPAAEPVILAHVADGKNQYDAVNYGQLSSLQSDFESRLGTMDDRIDRIEATGGGSGGETGGTVSNDLISGSGDAGRAVTPVNLGNGSNSVAIGSASTINGDAGNATAVGANSTVGAAGGTAMGAGADAHAANSTAIGQGASARGENSVAIGAGSVANDDNTVSFGDGSDQGNRRIVHIADGFNASDAATKGQLDRAVGGLQGQINGISRNAYSGIAAATALTMIPGVDPGKMLSFGIGSASYKGYQAIAFGGEARITKNLKMKAGVGLSSGGNTVGIGASYQW